MKKKIAPLQQKGGKRPCLSKPTPRDGAILHYRQEPKHEKDHKHMKILAWTEIQKNGTVTPILSPTQCLGLIMKMNINN